MGADQALHVASEDQLHPLRIAQILESLVKMKGFNLVLMGKQAIDDDYNQTVMQSMCEKHDAQFV